MDYLESYPEYPSKTVAEPKAVLLWSSFASGKSQTAKQNHCKDRLLAKKVRFDQCDGAQADNKKFRDKFFNISKVKGKYPQVFIKKGHNIKYVGTYDDIQDLLDAENDENGNSYFDAVFHETQPQKAKPKAKPKQNEVKQQSNQSQGQSGQQYYNPNNNNNNNNNGNYMQQQGMQQQYFNPNQQMQQNQQYYNPYQQQGMQQQYNPNQQQYYNPNMNQQNYYNPNMQNNNNFVPPPPNNYGNNNNQQKKKKIKPKSGPPRKALPTCN